MPTHNLVNLAKATKIPFKDEDLDFFSEVNAFNLKTRYDDYRRKMYKKATKGYTTLYLDKIKAMQKWILEQI
ncbi:hypothetical protein L6255_00245 [Candidatus Parcubacteria bacterium]|nr:hypothetical protein [Patescibacteria group bacterium]MCG2688870.1 hypothetical protein [Candidatus Parcubacteria bacterium]